MVFVTEPIEELTNALRNVFREVRDLELSMNEQGNTFQDNSSIHNYVKRFSKRQTNVSSLISSCSIPFLTTL